MQLDIHLQCSSSRGFSLPLCNWIPPTRLRSVIHTHTRALAHAHTHTQPLDILQARHPKSAQRLVLLLPIYSFSFSLSLCFSLSLSLPAVFCPSLPRSCCSFCFHCDTTGFQRSAHSPSPMRSLSLSLSPPFSKSLSTLSTCFTTLPGSHWSEYKMDLMSVLLCVPVSWMPGSVYRERYRPGWSA